MLTVRLVVPVGDWLDGMLTLIAYVVVALVDGAVNVNVCAPQDALAARAGTDRVANVVLSRLRVIVVAEEVLKPLL
jgi:hypothetical protein